MALSKHDSMVLSEVIAAFALIALLSIALFLSFIWAELKESNRIAKQAVSVTTNSMEKKDPLEKNTPEKLCTGEEVCSLQE